MKMKSRKGAQIERLSDMLDTETQGQSLHAWACRSTSRRLQPHLLVLALLLILLPLSQLQAGQEGYDSGELKQQIEAARQQLDEAARHLAELNMRMFEVDTEGEQSSRPMLGVLLDDVERADGVLLVGVTPMGGATDAGLQAGDLLVAINGQRLDSGDSSMHELHDAMSSVEAGDTVTVEYLRDGGVQTATITTQARGAFAMEVLGNLDVNNLSGLENPQQLGSPQIIQGFATAEALGTPGDFAGLEPLPHLAGMVQVSNVGGLELEDVQGDLARYFGVEQGVVVMSVPDGTELKAGDVLLSLDGEEVVSANAAFARLGAAESDLAAEVLREKQQLSLEIAQGMTAFSQPQIIRLHSGPIREQAPDATR